MQIHAEHNDTMKTTSDTVLLEKYTSHFIWKGSKSLLKVLLWEGVGDRTEQQHIALPSPSGHSHVSFSFSWTAQPDARRPSFLLSAGFLYRILSLTGPVSKITDFLSSPSYIIVQSPTQYLPITGHRNVSLPLSLEWHVWFSSSGNNCLAGHRSLSSGASVWLYCRILPCPILSAPTPM